MMRNFFTLCMASLIAFASLAQTKTRVPDEVLNKAVEMSNHNNNNVQMPFKVAPSTKSVALAPQEIEVGHTYYDLQSNAALSNRFYRYDDGSIVATWTGGMEASAFNDRGSFYNYWTKLQDQTWGWSINPDDVGRIEGYRAGWPSYSPYENGEIIVSHSSGVGLHKRDQVGTGDWSLTTQSISSTSNSWPRACVNNGTIHVLEGHQITTTTPSQNYVYYSRSKDGGQTWAPQGETPELIGSDYYNTLAFSADRYVWAEPKDGIIAFALFSNFADLVIMKSYDDGDTWEKIIVWEHPIPFFNNYTTLYADTLYAPNGSGSIVIDDDGICHLAFNVGRYLVAELEASSYFPALGHAFYWNETLGQFTDLNNPYDALHVELHPEYLQDGRCILAYGFDFDGDGSWFGEDGTIDVFTYYRCTGPISHISMTQVSADRLVLALAVTDESAPLTAGGSTYYAKRIFLCSYVFNEIYEEWRFDTNWVTDPDMVSYDLFSETPTQINNEGWYRMIKGFAHSFDECIYPQVLAQNVPAGELRGNFYVFYNLDQMPGDALTQHDNNPQYGTYEDNTIIMWASSMDFGDPNFPEIKLGIEQHGTTKQLLDVYPNPASNMVNITVEETVNCVIYNMAGQTVAKQVLTPGNNIINIQTLKSGVYFISAGNNNAKLIVE